jgi:2-polyprenyl-3-methyl-5-hydroxy-6-metoxy-1,4-benzoquinol methylase
MSDAIRKFGVDHADTYWRDRQNENRVTERRLHRFLRDIADQIAPDGGKVLDCGMGAGHVFRLCSEKHETYGVEMSSQAIAMYDFPIDNVRQADLNEGIPSFSVKFDVIILSMVLHWLDDPEKFIRTIDQYLSPTGRLVVVIPNITNYHYRIGFLFGKFPPISPSHKNFQTPCEVEQMIEKAHCRIEQVLSPKKSFKTRFWPRLFSTDIVYVLKPNSLA